MKEKEVDRYYRENPDCLRGMFIAQAPDGKPVARKFPDDARDNPPDYVFVFDSAEVVEPVMRSIRVCDFKVVKVDDSKKLLNQCRRRGVRVFPNPHKGDVVTITMQPDGTSKRETAGLPRDTFLTRDQLAAWLRLVEHRLEREATANAAESVAATKLKAAKKKITTKRVKKTKRREK